MSKSHTHLDLLVYNQVASTIESNNVSIIGCWNLLSHLLYKKIILLSHWSIEGEFCHLVLFYPFEREFNHNIVKLNKEKIVESLLIFP